MSTRELIGTLAEMVAGIGDGHSRLEYDEVRRNHRCFAFRDRCSCCWTEARSRPPRVTAVLRHRKRASFIGDESGGTYEGNTSGLNALITLPHSRLRLKVQMYGYVNAVSGGRKGRGTLPDHAVAKTTVELLRGIDAPLERATALARASVK